MLSGLGRRIEVEQGRDHEYLLENLHFGWRRDERLMMLVKVGEAAVEFVVDGSGFL